MWEPRPDDKNKENRDFGETFLPKVEPELVIGRKPLIIRRF